MAEKKTALSEENIFLDNVTVAVDLKLRVAIPERFMKVLKNVAPDYADRIGVIPTADRSLKLMPYPAFMEKLAYWRSLNDDISEHRTIRSFVLKLAKVHQLDGQNRLKLTDQQVKFCNITRKAIIVGDIEAMQLYDPDLYEQTLLKDMQKFAEASDQVAKAAGLGGSPAGGPPSSRERGH